LASKGLQDIAPVAEGVAGEQSGAG
jgi:hypothetical protein